MPEDIVGLPGINGAIAAAESHIAAGKAALIASTDGVEGQELEDLIRALASAQRYIAQAVDLAAAGINK